MFGVEGTSSLHFATNAKMIGGGLDEQLEKFVREHSDTKLIIVDTLQKVREAGPVTPHSLLDDIPECEDITPFRNSVNLIST